MGYPQKRMRPLVLLSCLVVGQVLAIVHDVPRTWSILHHLLPQDHQALQELYPIVTGLEEGQEYLDNFLDEPVAQLFRHYYDLYPNGFLSSAVLNSSNHFVLNNHIYSSPEDLFYLKTSDLKQHVNRPFLNEVIIGDNLQAPIIEFYGCPENDTFNDFNRNLYSEAISTKKIRFVWRSTCVPKLEDELDPSLYPLEISAKNNELDSLDGEPWNLPVPVPREFKQRKYKFQIPSLGELANLDLQAASLILEKFHKSNFEFMIEFAKNLVNNFLLLIPKISKAAIDERIRHDLSFLNKKGIDYNMLGLYINGQNLRLSTLSLQNLLESLRQEYDNFQTLSNILPKFTVPELKNLIYKYAQNTLTNLHELQPIKVDLHRIGLFSESVIYFNDIETDPQYEELSTDVEKFFDKSKFGELPEFRQNWNEIVFIIDFDNLQNEDSLEALTGLLRAINVVQQGYPQRIGLLPLGNLESDVIKTIYELKKSGMEELRLFLGELAETPALEDIEIAHSDYRDIPDVTTLLKELEIVGTSIIIDGEIYPFKKNTWNYLIAKVIKKDVTAIRKELSRSKRRASVINVRGLLHLRSADSINSKYTPNYFADSLYTRTDNELLQEMANNTLYYVTNKAYNSLHTITLVDDFSTKEALTRLCNLLRIKFSGVRIRFYHTGALSSSNWHKLNDIFKKNNDILAEVSKLKAERQKHEINMNHHRTILQKWLPDIPTDYIQQYSSFIILNGRFIHLEKEEVPSVKLIEALIRREATRTLDTIYCLEELYDGFSEQPINSDLIESLTSVLARMMYQPQDVFHNGIEFTTESTLSRMDLRQFTEPNNITTFRQENDDGKPIDLLLILDPLEERSQKLLSLADHVKDLSFINLQLLLLPTENLQVMPISRIYYEQSEMTAEGLSDLSQTYDIKLDAPSQFSLENFTTMRGIYIEVHAFQEDEAISQSNINGVGGVCLELVDEAGDVVSTTRTMGTFGYGQLFMDKLCEACTIRSCDPRFNVTSFSKYLYSDYIPLSELRVSGETPSRVFVKLATIGHDDKVAQVKDHNINVFTALKNQKEQDAYMNMVLSILNHNSGKDKHICFWILEEPYFSKKFSQFCQTINNDTQLKGQVNFIKYRWPAWLRPQRYREREVDVSGILFADVLFPSNVETVVYMKPHTESTIDPMHLLNSQPQFQGSFAMAKMQGHGYWEDKYWTKLLQEGNLHFHTTEPAIVVNVTNILKNHHGDMLRIHYQRLSASLHSLVNIDQDLLNDIQRKVPITEIPSRALQYIEMEDADKFLHDEL